MDGEAERAWSHAAGRRDRAIRGDEGLDVERYGSGIQMTAALEFERRVDIYQVHNLLRRKRLGQLQRLKDGERCVSSASRITARMRSAISCRR
jgi:hypothetical protein